MKLEVETLEELSRFKMTEVLKLLIVKGIQYNPHTQTTKFIIVGKIDKGLIAPNKSQIAVTKKQYKKENKKHTPGPNKDFQ